MCTLVPLPKKRSNFHGGDVDLSSPKRQTRGRESPSLVLAECTKSQPSLIDRGVYRVRPAGTEAAYRLARGPRLESRLASNRKAPVHYLWNRPRNWSGVNSSWTARAGCHLSPATGEQSARPLARRQFHRGRAGLAPLTSH